MATEPAQPADRGARDLAAFTGAGYDKGRGIVWQAAWFAVMNVVFMKWWCPASLRPVLLRVFGATIGKDVLIRHRVRVQWPWKLTVGDDCWVGEGVWLMNLEQITVGDDVCLSQEAVICTGSHRHEDPAFRFDNGPVEIGSGAWVAARATVLRGTTVPPGALVAAGAVIGRGAFEKPSGVPSPRSSTHLEIELGSTSQVDVTEHDSSTR